MWWFFPQIVIVTTSSTLHLGVWTDPFVNLTKEGPLDSICQQPCFLGLMYSDCMSYGNWRNTYAVTLRVFEAQGCQMVPFTSSRLSTLYRIERTLRSHSHDWVHQPLDTKLSWPEGATKGLCSCPPALWDWCLFEIQFVLGLRVPRTALCPLAPISGLEQ